MDTQNDGFEKVDTFDIWPFLVSMIDFWNAHDLPSLELTARENWSLGDYFDFGARSIFRGALVRWIEYGRIYSTSTNTKHEDLESREGKVKVHTLHTPAWYELSRSSRYCSVSKEVPSQTQPQAANPQFSKLPVHHESSSPKQRVAWNLVSSFNRWNIMFTLENRWLEDDSFPLGNWEAYFRTRESNSCWLTWWIEQTFCCLGQSVCPQAEPSILFSCTYPCFRMLVWDSFICEFSSWICLRFVNSLIGVHGWFLSKNLRTPVGWKGFLFGIGLEYYLNHANSPWIS